jgi:hypothetical protein
MDEFWFTKEQIEKEKQRGRFNSPWDEDIFRSRILQDWLNMHGQIEELRARLNRKETGETLAYIQTVEIQKTEIERLRAALNESRAALDGKGGE